MLERGVFTKEMLRDMNVQYVKSEQRKFLRKLNV